MSVVFDGAQIPTDDPFKVSDAAYDYAIAGLHFNAVASPEMAIERAFARVSKEQVSVSDQPGDQQLDGWWIRSTTDWSWGAGYEYMEPITKEPIPYTFNWSYGVDPWVEGQLSLLRKPFRNVGLPVSKAKAQIISYRGYVYVSGESSGKPRIWRYAINEFSTPNNAIPAGSTWADCPSAVLQFIIAQGYLLVSTEKDGVLLVQADGTLKPLFTSPKGAIRCWYTKDRLIMAAGNSLYQDVIKDIYTPKALDKPFYTSPEEGWKWLASSSTPSAILIAGAGEEYSNIVSVTAESDSAGAPTLGAPRVVVELPQGEAVRDIKAYLGSYLLISTTSGVRLGIINDQDRVTYGPLMDSPLPTGPFSVYDRFAFYPVKDAGEGRSGLVRIDLSRVNEDQKPAWALDLRVSEFASDPAGTCQVLDSAVIASKTMVLLAQSWRGVFLYSVQPGCNTEPYGVIQSGWIRMGSTVPKNWARFSLSTEENMKGGVKAQIVTPAGVTDVGTMRNPDYEKEWSFAEQGLCSPHAAIRLILASAAFPDNPTPPLPPPDPPSPEPGPDPDPGPGPGPAPGQQSWNQLRTVTWRGLLNTGLRWKDVADARVQAVGAGEDHALPESTDTPVVDGWGLRGMPAIPRTEMIKVSVLCFDYEIGNQGMKVGADAQAIKRYKALEERLAANRIVQFTDINNRHTDPVSVEEMSFRQVAPPSIGSGFGGVIDLVMRVM